jgi:hypothetical protein
MMTGGGTLATASNELGLPAGATYAEEDGVLVDLHHVGYVARRARPRGSSASWSKAKAPSIAFASVTNRLGPALQRSSPVTVPAGHDLGDDDSPKGAAPNRGRDSQSTNRPRLTSGDGGARGGQGVPLLHPFAQ